MREDDLDRRIQDELDGVATAEESAELRRRLDTSPAARARYDEMKTVFHMLDRVEAEDPPTGLKERVILSLPPAVPHVRPGILRGAFQRRHGLGWGYSFAGGLAAGVLLAVLASGLQNPRPRSLDDSKFSGSMAPIESNESALVDRTRLDLSGDVVRVETRQAGPDVLVRMESAAGSDVLLEYDASVFDLRSFHRAAPASGPVEIAPGRILIRNAGQGRYEFVFHPAESARPTLQVSLGQGDNVVVRSLRTGPARRE